MKLFINAKLIIPLSTYHFLKRLNYPFTVSIDFESNLCYEFTIENLVLSITVFVACVFNIFENEIFVFIFEVRLKVKYPIIG